MRKTLRLFLLYAAGAAYAVCFVLALHYVVTYLENL
jgi:hypothetical protein